MRPPVKLKKKIINQAGEQPFRMSWALLVTIQEGSNLASAKSHVILRGGGHFTSISIGECNGIISACMN